VSTRPKLDVYAGTQLSGLLARSQIEEDAFLFGYAEDCPAEDAVSITMPVIRDQYDSSSGLLPIFEMNLPEGVLLESLRRQFAKVIPHFDSLDLLAIVGQSQIGRLRYAQSGTMPAPLPEENLSALLTYSGTDDLFAELMRRYASHSGISGMQPKVLVRESSPRMPRLTHRSATHIVKSFDPREYPELAANEFFCIRAAHHAGIPAPNVRLSDNRRILLVDRFDLGPDVSYLGCEDFCVLNGLRAHGRYQGSYEGVAERIAQFVSLEHQRAAYEQFFLTVALSCAIGNGDAHLKNFAVLYENPERPVRLAPSYDLICTTLYQANDVLALTLGGSKSFPGRKRLITFGREACNLTTATTADLLDRIAASVERAIRDIRRYAKGRVDFAPAGTRLIGAFKRGAARIAH
jgi:serine/threonine-protein kinase HipA